MLKQGHSSEKIAHISGKSINNLFTRSSSERSEILSKFCLSGGQREGWEVNLFDKGDRACFSESNDML